MKVVIFQGYGPGNNPTREEMINMWKGKLENLSYIDELRFEGETDFTRLDEQVLDADAVRADNVVLTPQIELCGMTMGILGLGNIGRYVGQIAAGFGMQIIGYSRSKKEGKEYDFIKQVSFDELLAESDVLSIHCPATSETIGIINSRTIEKMKDGVIILNTARGDIINEPNLIDALNSGKVYAAGLDVLCGEPLRQKSELMNCKNTKITQHIAWASRQGRIRMVEVASANFKNWAAGNATSVINA